MLVIRARQAVEADDLSAAPAARRRGRGPGRAARRRGGAGRRPRPAAAEPRHAPSAGRPCARPLPRPPGAVRRGSPPAAARTPSSGRCTCAVSAASGKTMLIRYLASGRYAAEQGPARIPIARVDFDHIEPGLPGPPPVQLLLELADELALHTAAVTGRTGRCPGSAPLPPARTRRSAASARRAPRLCSTRWCCAAIDDFAAALAAAPRGAADPRHLRRTRQGRRRRPGRARRPGHARPSSSASTARRRPSGCCSPAAGRCRRATTSPWSDVAGFTVDEASGISATFSATPLAPALADAMIRQSPAVERPALARACQAREPLRPGPVPGLGGRRSRPRRRGASSGGSDAYVEGRIIERLRDPRVLAALPLLALRRPVPGRDARLSSTGGAAAVLGPRLAEQEWIDADGDPPVHVAAKPALASELQHYFGAQDRAAGFAATDRPAGAGAARQAAPLRRWPISTSMSCWPRCGCPSRPRRRACGTTSPSGPRRRAAGAGCST